MTWGILNVNSTFKRKNAPTVFSQISKSDFDMIKYLYINKNIHKGI